MDRFVNNFDDYEIITFIKKILKQIFFKSTANRYLQNIKNIMQSKNNIKKYYIVEFNNDILFANDIVYLLKKKL